MPKPSQASNEVGRSVQDTLQLVTVERVSLHAQCCNNQAHECMNETHGDFSSKHMVDQGHTQNSRVKKLQTRGISILQICSR